MTKFDIDFNDYLIKEYGSSDMIDIYNFIKHEYLSKFLDLPEYKLPLVIGVLKDDAIRKRKKQEIEAMIKFYNDHPEDINTLKSEL